MHIAREIVNLGGEHAAEVAGRWIAVVEGIEAQIAYLAAQQ
jgi:hypothetical protein